MRCPYCESENVDYANFCIACGHAFPHPVAASGKIAARAPHRQHGEALHQRSQAREYRARSADRRAPASAARHATEAGSKPARHSPHPSGGPAHFDDQERSPVPPGRPLFSPLDAGIQYPPARSSSIHWVLIAAVLAVVSFAGFAATVWMRPASLPASAALLNRFSETLGIQWPSGPAGKRPKFGTSADELPYGGDFLQPKASESRPAYPVEMPQPAQEDSSGSSAAADDPAAKQSETPVDVAQATENRSEVAAPAVSVAAAQTLPGETVSALPAPPLVHARKKPAVSHAVRDREIRRLRRQAEKELDSG